MAEILIIDDHDSMREGLELLLRRRGHRTRSAESGRRGMELLDQEGADLVITGHGTIEKVVEAMKLGAADFITKPFSSEEFGVKVDRLVAEREERQRLRRENVALRVENAYLRGDSGVRYGEMVGESPSMQEVFRWIDRVARTDSTVMVYGESGTGKELVARAIHAGSPRRDGPFVRVNCGALNENLLDSELFGHEKGAFTGAERRRRGRFELADGGTLFLDEIATVPHTTQVRLLRVLQERELERVGGEETISVDVRIVAATNAAPDALRSDGSFREDLFYRLHVVPITLPPLRDRKEDIALLVNHFIDKLGKRTASPARAASAEVLRLLATYEWPGNVRELENVVERALVLADGEELCAEDLPALGGMGAGTAQLRRNGRDHQDADSAFPSAGLDLNIAVERMEERLLRQALDQAAGVKAEAARLLGLKPSALYYKLEKYGIEA